MIWLRELWGASTTIVARASAEGRAALADPRGLSLVEVLISAVIVGIAAVGVALMFSTGQTYIAAEGDNRASLLLAQQRIEKIRAMGYTGLGSACLPSPTATCPGGITENVSGRGESPCISGDACYQRVTNIECVNRDNYTGSSEACVSGTTAWRIEVTVSVPGEGKTQPVQMMSIMSPR